VDAGTAARSNTNAKKGKGAGDNSIFYSECVVVVVSTHWRRRNSGTTMLKVNDTVESTTDLFFVFHYTLMTWVKRRVSLSPTHVNLTPPKLLQDPERNGTWYVEIYR
jgi:hypothetical protein